ncbi:hypothetical protein F5X97DRAFT_338364 [Nemania serpens]|nr:hypothetical protein F5X97DRAFT_338364 [Nemania serpens]
MCSTSYKDGSIELVMQLWRKASMQIDSPFHAMKLRISTFNRLGPKGQNYFIWHCSLLLGKPAEFILDKSDPDCVYLGNSDDLEKVMDSIVVRNPEDKLPFLYQRQPVQKHVHQP